MDKFKTFTVTSLCADPECPELSHTITYDEEEVAEAAASIMEMVHILVAMGYRASTVKAAVALMGETTLRQYTELRPHIEDLARRLRAEVLAKRAAEAAAKGTAH